MTSVAESSDVAGGLDRPVALHLEVHAGVQSRSGRAAADARRPRRVVGEDGVRRRPEHGAAAQAQHDSRAARPRDREGAPAGCARRRSTGCRRCRGARPDGNPAAPVPVARRTAVAVGNEFDDAEVERLLVELHHQGEDATPTPTAAATGRNRVARNVVITATWEIAARSHDRHDLVGSERPDGGHDEHRGEGRHDDVADDLREGDEDDRQPEAGEDGRPPATAPAETLTAV